MDAFRSNVLTQANTLTLQAGRLKLTVGCKGFVQRVRSEQASPQGLFSMSVTDQNSIIYWNFCSIISMCEISKKYPRSSVSQCCPKKKRLCCQKAGSWLNPTVFSQLVGVGHVQRHSHGISKQLSDSDSIFQSRRDFYLSALQHHNALSPVAGGLTRQLAWLNNDVAKTF